MKYITLLILPTGELDIDSQLTTYEDKYDRIIDNFNNPLIEKPKVIMNEEEIGRASKYYVMDEGMYFELELDNNILLYNKYPRAVIEDSIDSDGKPFPTVLTKIILENMPQFIGQEIKELNKELQMPDPAKYQDQGEWMSVCIPAVMGEGLSQDEAKGKCIGIWQNKSQSITPPPEKKSKIEIIHSIAKLIEKGGYAISDEKILEMFSSIGDGNGYLSKLNRKLDSSIKVQEIKVFPKKKVYIEKYDEYIDFNDQLFNEMIDGFNCEKLFKPYVDEDHQLKEKFADILSLENREDGLYAKIQLNEKGKEVIKNNVYSYISPEWGDRKDTDGNDHKNVLWAITLTNIPALEGENPKLQDQIKLSKTGGLNMLDELNKRLSALEGKVKTYKLQDEVPGMPPEIMNVISEAMMMIQEAVAKVQEVTQQKEEAIAQKEVAEQSALDYKEKFDNIEAEKLEAEKDTFFEQVVSNGQLEASEVEDWKLQYDKSKEFVVKMLTKNPKKESAQLTKTSVNGKNNKLSAEDYAIMDQYPMYLNEDGTYKEALYIKNILGGNANG